MGPYPTRTGQGLPPVACVSTGGASLPRQVDLEKQVLTFRPGLCLLRLQCRRSHRQPLSPLLPAAAPLHGRGSPEPRTGGRSAPASHPDGAEPEAPRRRKRPPGWVRVPSGRSGVQGGRRLGGCRGPDLGAPRGRGERPARRGGWCSGPGRAGSGAQGGQISHGPSPRTAADPTAAVRRRPSS